MKKSKYICLEGTEGVGKTTQTRILAAKLRDMGFKVLQTSEPGSPHSELTMTLRKIMLDNQYDEEMTRPAREFVSQAIRSIHLERVIIPAMFQYDYIIQDRGILSGYSYGEACGNKIDDLRALAMQVVDAADPQRNVFSTVPDQIYDSVIYLTGDVLKKLEVAKGSKQEFATGDAMESKDNSFYQRVAKNMNEYSLRFKTTEISVDGKTIEQVHDEILMHLFPKGI